MSPADYDQHMRMLRFRRKRAEGDAVKWQAVNEHMERLKAKRKALRKSAEGKKLVPLPTHRVGGGKRQEDVPDEVVVSRLPRWLACLYALSATRLLRLHMVKLDGRRKRAGRARAHSAGAAHGDASA